MAVTSAPLPTSRSSARSTRFIRQLRRRSTVTAGSILLLLIGAMAVAAPLLQTHDPQSISPIARLQGPSAEHLFGTDMLGRDLYSRVVHGAKISLIVGISVAACSIGVGLVVGMLTGFIRWVDTVIMRFMDGLMAIPPILLAIALMALTGASIENVIMAIAIAEVPRVVRLVRSVVLGLREEPFVEAAVASGTPLHRILRKHILPNTMAPLLVQGTYIFASAMILESVLSFIGAGTPPEIPSWGNIMAEGRSYFNSAPYIILFPGVFLSIAVLSVNLLGDGLRDALDPRLARRM